MENTTEESLKVNEQLENLDINKEEAETTTTTTKLSKGQKKRLKEKEKKLKQQQEQESGTAATPLPVEPPKPETPAEKFNRQIEWAIYQLILGQQRKDTTKEQWKESETIINKLKSDKIHDARKIQLMHSVFGKNLDKVMKQYPLPKNYTSITKSTESTSTTSTTANITTTTTTTTTTTPTEATTTTTSN